MKIFIGSSTEAADKTNPNNILLKVAGILRGAGAEPVAWNDDDYDLFSVGNTTIENLETIVTRENIDASIFIYSADDKIWWRDKINDKIVEKNAPRDNVLFEHGLFSGILGRKKSIIIKYGEVDKIPSDLYGVTYIDLSDQNKESGKSRLIRWVNDLKGNKGTDTIKSKSPLCEFHIERENIQQELDNIKKSGVIKVFEDQAEAVKKFKEEHGDLEIKTTQILGIRGDNFVNEGKSNWSSIIPIDSFETTILGNSDDKDMVMNRYEAQKLRKDEDQEMFRQRYRKAMLHAQNVLKEYPNNTLYIHDKSDLPFRMIFIDDYLFLSTYDKEKIAPDAEVIKIYKSSALYSMCKDYFDKIKKNSKNAKDNK